MSSPGPAAVDGRDLAVRYEPRRSWRSWPPGRPVGGGPALDGATFSIEPGEAVACIGPAGAGKSALVDLIAGTLAPTAGSLLLFGAPSDSGGRVGVVGRRPLLWHDLPVSDSLVALAHAHEPADVEWPARRDELVDRLGLAAFIGHPPSRLPPGRRIRAELAAALLTEPDLLVLDAAAGEMDAATRERVRSFLQDENRLHGRALLVTGREVGEVEELCPRLLVLAAGRLVHDGDLAGLIARSGVQRTLVVDLTDAGHRLDDVPGTRLVGVEAGGLRQHLTFVPGSGVPTARVLADVTARAGIRDLALNEPDLSEVIRRL